MKRSLICILLIICKVFRVDLNESLKQCNNTTTISYVLSMHMLLVREVASGATIRCCLIFFAFLLCLDFALSLQIFTLWLQYYCGKSTIWLSFYLPLPLTFTANTFPIALILLSLSLRGERGNLIPRDLRANVANLDPNSNKHFAALLFCKRCAETGTQFSDNPAFDSNKRVLYFAE